MLLQFSNTQIKCHSEKGFLFSRQTNFSCQDRFMCGSGRWRALELMGKSKIPTSRPESIHRMVLMGPELFNS